MKYRKFKFIPFMILGIFFFGLLVMALWNWLIPAIFSGPEVTYFQAIGLFALAKILTGFPHRHHHGMHHGGRSYWKSRFSEKWSNMSPEEKKKYRNCCHPGEEDELETKENSSSES